MVMVYLKLILLEQIAEGYCYQGCFRSSKDDQGSSAHTLIVVRARVAISNKGME